MKEIIEKLKLLEADIIDNSIEVAHLFEVDEEEDDKKSNLRVNAQVLKVLSEKAGVEPQKLRVTLGKVLREQNVNNEGRQHIAAMLKLILRQQPAFLNRMK